MIVVVSENTSAGFLLQIENEEGFDLAVFCIYEQEGSPLVN